MQHKLSRFGLGFAAGLLALSGLASQSAVASDVQIYGQLDYGLIYKDGKGAPATFTMDSGVDVSTLWGIRVVEELDEDK